MFRINFTRGALLAAAVALLSIPSLAQAGHPVGCFPPVSHCQPCYSPCYRPVTFTQPCYSIYGQPCVRTIYVPRYIPTPYHCSPFCGNGVIIR